MSSLPNTYLTPQQYLEIERQAEYKSEYYRGEMFAMGGASKEHNSIGVNIIGNLYPQLRDRDCKAYANDLRVKVSATKLYTYPDVVVACGGGEFEDDHLDVLLNPCVIFEVLSKSTEAYDRGAKFEQYRTLESLTDYVLVAQDRRHVEHFEKQADGTWKTSYLNEPQQVLELRSISCRLSLEDVYFKVELPSASEPQE